MSFIKKYLNNVDEIVEAIIESPADVYRVHTNADALIGPTKSMDLIDEFVKAYQENPEQDFSGIISKYKN